MIKSRTTFGWCSTGIFLKGLFLFSGVMLLNVIFFPCGVCEASEPLIVGVLHSENYTYAEMMKNSFEMALKEINGMGGVKGRPLKLIYADDEGEPRPGEKAVKELIKKQKAVLLVGGYQSSNTLQMAVVADKLNRPFLICTAADDRITRRQLKNIYRMNAPAREYAKGLEDLLLEEIKPASMAIVYENSPYGTGGAEQMMRFCRKNGIEIADIEPYHKERARKEDMGSAYLDRVLKSVKASSPDVIYMVSYLNDGALLVKKIRELKIRSLLCGGAGGFTHEKFISRAGASAEYLLTATLWTHQLRYPGTKTYYEQYLKTHSASPDYHGAEAYSALLVAADALNRADAFAPENIRAALDETDMTTPFGPVRFESYDAFERQNRLATQVLQIVDGNFECIWPKTLATAEFHPPSGWRRSK